MNDFAPQHSEFNQEAEECQREQNEMNYQQAQSAAEEEALRAEAQWQAELAQEMKGVKI